VTFVIMTKLGCTPSFVHPVPQSMMTAGVPDPGLITADTIAVRFAIFAHKDHIILAALVHASLPWFWRSSFNALGAPRCTVLWCIFLSVRPDVPRSVI
jgi:hypothetical protein